MSTFKLTESQQTALTDFKDFLKGIDQVFILKGAAGTGKTTLVKEFISTLESLHRPMALMAPTGRAAFILAGKSGRQALTIHRSIYKLTKLKSANRGKEDEDDGMQAKFSLRDNSDSQDAVYIVDEASMVDNAYSEAEAFSFGTGMLMSDLFEYAGGRKIVFVGDYAQLPPIAMNFSPALDKEYIQNNFSCSVKEVTLREVLRQAGESMMLRNATRLRGCIESKTFTEFKVMSGEDTTAADDLLTPYYRLSADRPDVRSAIIVYTNRQALEYNISIRRHYYGADAQRLVAGDLLMIARNNYSYQEELFNGNVVRVMSCHPDDKVERRSVNVKTGNGRVDTVELKFRGAEISFNAGGRAVCFHVSLLDNFLDEPSGQISGLLARALIVDFNTRLPRNIKEALPAINKSLRNHVPLTGAQSELYDKYLHLLLNDRYYNAVFCKYGYAMTCHKAQGGEWDNVFVDMSRAGGKNNEDYFRWAYTALTRASKHIWHFASPDFDYLSQLDVCDILPSKDIKISIYSPDKDFCGVRFSRLKSFCQQAGLSITEDKSRQNQHLVTIYDNKGASATFILWYNKSGYSLKDNLQRATSDGFADKCRQMIDASAVPEFVPFSAPGRPFAEKLADHVRTLLAELDIQLLNIVHEGYQDIYHIKADGPAKLHFTYNGKGFYTNLKPISAIGPADTRLEALLQKFI